MAQPVAPPSAPGIYLQAARAAHQTDAWTVGITLPWSHWHKTILGSDVRGYWDVYLSQWAAEGKDGRLHSTLIGITPSFRLMPGGTQSRWFLDAGIGATLSSKRYVTRYKEMSTRFNFATHVGLGVALGTEHQHEVQLRVEHVSNAGIKEPNPGENSLQLRYAMHF